MIEYEVKDLEKLPYKVRVIIMKLIDAVNGEKLVYQCPRCATSMEVDPSAKPSGKPKV